MTRDDIIRMANEAGFYFHDAGYAPILHTTKNEYSEKCFERFAALVAAAERLLHLAETERLRELAMTAEKWRGLALCRDKGGDGSTVQEIQAEAREKALKEKAKPEGWKLVPVVPTKEMHTWIPGAYPSAKAEVWNKILEAAPEFKE